MGVVGDGLDEQISGTVETDHCLVLMIAEESEAGEAAFMRLEASDSKGGSDFGRIRDRGALR